MIVLNEGLSMRLLLPHPVWMEVNKVGREGGMIAWSKFTSGKKLHYGLVPFSHLHRFLSQGDNTRALSSLNRVEMNPHARNVTVVRAHDYALSRGKRWRHPSSHSFYHKLCIDTLHLLPVRQRWRVFLELDLRVFSFGIKVLWLG